MNYHDRGYWTKIYHGLRVDEPYKIGQILWLAEHALQEPLRCWTRRAVYRVLEFLVARDPERCAHYLLDNQSTCTWEGMRGDRFVIRLFLQNLKGSTAEQFSDYVSRCR